jgi:hypothetical protein
MRDTVKFVALSIDDDRYDAVEAAIDECVILRFSNETFRHDKLFRGAVILYPDEMNKLCKLWLSERGKTKL